MVTELEEMVEFAENPEPRCACVLLLDTSGSMAGEKIDALNEGIRTLQGGTARRPAGFPPCGSCHRHFR
jgi:hypothetical protein